MAKESAAGGDRVFTSQLPVTAWETTPVLLTDQWVGWAVLPASPELTQAAAFSWAAQLGAVSSWGSWASLFPCGLSSWTALIHRVLRAGPRMQKQMLACLRPRLWNPRTVTRAILLVSAGHKASLELRGGGETLPPNEKNYRELFILTHLFTCEDIMPEKIYQFFCY